VLDALSALGFIEPCAAGRCAPPDNKPTPEELGNCFIYLEKEYELLKRCELILCLGRIAYDTTRKLLEKKGVEPPPANGFGHGKYFDLKKRKVLCSYHPSQQNTQTGRLTWEMWRGIFARAKELVGASDFA
jgi:uracil-DNA glycosylase family 4